MRAASYRVRGWHVGVFLAGFFGLMVAVNLAFVFAALKTHPGDDVPNAYQQGLAFNDVLQARRAQAHLGWQARVETGFDDKGTGLITISIADKTGAPVSALRVAGTLKHPAEARLDRGVNFKPVAPGRYQSAFAAPHHVHWNLDVVAMSEEGAVFHMRQRL